MKVLRHYLRLNAKAVVYALVMAAIAQSCLLLDPLIMQHVLDRYSHLPRTAEWSDFLSGTAVWLGAIVASVALAWISKSEQTVTVDRVSQLVGAGIFSDGVRSCLRMPFFNFEKQRSGERVEGLHRLRRNIEKLLKTFFNKIFTSLLALVLIIVYTTHVYWGLTLCFLTVAPTLTWISFLVTRSIRKTNEELLRRHSGIAGNTTETLRNIELVKSLGLTQQEISRFDEDAAAIVKLELRKVKASRVYTFFHGACVHLMRLGLLTLLLYLRFRNLISMGQPFPRIPRNGGVTDGIFRPPPRSSRGKYRRRHLREDPDNRLRSRFIPLSGTRQYRPEGHLFPCRRRGNCRVRRSFRRRQDHARQTDLRSLPTAHRLRPLQRHSRHGTRPGSASHAHGPGHAGHPAVFRIHSG